MGNIKENVNVLNADKKQLRAVQGRYATNHDVVDDVDLMTTTLLPIGPYGVFHLMTHAIDNDVRLYKESIKHSQRKSTLLSLSAKYLLHEIGIISPIRLQFDEVAFFGDDVAFMLYEVSFMLTLSGYGVAVAVGKDFFAAFPDRTFYSPVVDLTKIGRNGNLLIILAQVSYFVNIQDESASGAKEFFGTEGAVGLLTWFESTESVLHITKCPAESQVEFAASMLQGRALTWWNTLVQTRGRATAIAQP
ncbi:hypothetical protein Tco_0633872 [Tanacetum coccineum]